MFYDNSLWSYSPLTRPSICIQVYWKGKGCFSSRLILKFRPKGRFLDWTDPIPIFRKEKETKNSISSISYLSPKSGHTNNREYSCTMSCDVCLIRFFLQSITTWCHFLLSPDASGLQWNLSVPFQLAEKTSVLNFHWQRRVRMRVDIFIYGPPISHHVQG